MKKIFLILLFTCFFAEQNMCLIPQYDKMQQRGCCSWRGGVCGCSGGKARCCDGTLSPSCGC